MDKIYVGNGKEMFDGDMISFALNLSKLGQAKDHYFEFNGEKYIKLKVVKKRDGADQYGKTHYIEVDTFKPKENSNPSYEKLPDADAPNDDIPF